MIYIRSQQCDVVLGKSPATGAGVGSFKWSQLEVTPTLKVILVSCKERCDSMMIGALV
jgi:hypothetical protein